jgi:hypothetical protein
MKKQLIQMGIVALIFGGVLSANAITVVAVPEPASMLLFGAGLMGLASIRSRRSKK